MTRSLERSTFSIDGYLAVIPKIQNVYSPEKVHAGFQWGFKYESGVFEFFTLRSLSTARIQYMRLKEAIDNYYQWRR